MKKQHIELIDDEKALVEVIDLRVLHADHNQKYASDEEEKRPSLYLTEFLTECRAISKEFLNYWNETN